MDTRPTPPLTETAPPPSVGALFFGFLKLGLMGFGGVLPFARRMMVEDRRWLTPAEFTDLLGLCQFLPGGNIINMSVAIGLKFRGVAGAFAALIGLIAMPTLIVIGLGALYDRYQDDAVVHHLFAGLAAGAAGLLIATAVKIAAPLRTNPAGIAIALAGFLFVAVLRLPLLVTLGTLAPLSILMAWRRAS
ncbi:chromate transporter [Azorhizobium sp. AG788]|uniref:chromate transporter n=1 Tax=Azorhizobium sp. AG788 TaxID=2183897 RepID=UPI00105D5540|nr:chromate transporter [Azorhizobium sp. AG788]TDT93484.1 chromate transporter [Azorhizobium sp. AG788]